ncbi:hypothetical protein BDF14DRAFT_1786063 [Spinellus fusiger]|nr:hypothetical protein BDF14DRAFT_1870485 [Spinellus fusiger]KAI7869219.1 hypothetical protein BDF14DRAFT_1786063 [Spinellus fusiger]
MRPISMPVCLSLFPPPTRDTFFYRRWAGRQERDWVCNDKASRFLSLSFLFSLLFCSGSHLLWGCWTGRVDPVPIELKLDSLGVGKADEEQSYHVSSTARRKALDSEKQLEETPEEKHWRESRVTKQEAIVRELKEVNRVFYCELCDKQYSKISEYEQHLQSYDHHHKKVRRLGVEETIHPRTEIQGHARTDKEYRGSHH